MTFTCYSCQGKPQPEPSKRFAFSECQKCGDVKWGSKQETKQGELKL